MTMSMWTIAIMRSIALLKAQEIVRGSVSKEWRWNKLNNAEAKGTDKRHLMHIN